MTPEEQAAADKAAAASRAVVLQNTTPVIIAGDANVGGAFSIDGPGLGSSGSLTIGGVPIKTSRWDDRSIRGVIPAGVKGAVVLTTQNGVRHGVFPYVRPLVVKTTTTVVETKPA